MLSVKYGHIGLTANRDREIGLRICEYNGTYQGYLLGYKTIPIYFKMSREKGARPKFSSENCFESTRDTNR